MQVSRFLQIYVFLPLRKTGPTDFPEKRAPTKVKHLLPVCQISGNFTEGNARKFTDSSAFCTHVDVIKYRKKHWRFLRARADYLSFRPQRACDRKTIVSHLKAHAFSTRSPFNNGFSWASKSLSSHCRPRCVLPVHPEMLAYAAREVYNHNLLIFVIHTNKIGLRFQ